MVMQPFDSLIHLQDSQTCRASDNALSTFDSLIHLQDSQTDFRIKGNCMCLIHLFTYKTLKPQIIKIGFSLSLTYGHML